MVLDLVLYNGARIRYHENCEDRKILRRILTKPVPTDLRWNDIESMLRGVGVEVKKRAGSRIALVKNGEVMMVRRPHPERAAVWATVRDIAAFLKVVGVKS